MSKPIDLSSLLYLLRLQDEDPPWYQLTSDEIPYLVLLIVGILAFILGGVFRPVVETLGNNLRQKILGLGKHGRFRQGYLTYIISRCRHLSLLPANVVAARWDYRRRVIELENLYSPLSLGKTLEGESQQEDELLISRSLRKPYSSSRRKARNIFESLWWRVRPPADPSAGELGKTIESYRRLVIRGEPGSGKTTLLRFLAITNARSLRNDKKDGDDSHLTKRRLGWRKKRFAIFVNLGAFTDVMGWPRKRRLIDAVVDTLPGELRRDYPDGFFENQLRKGNCLVLLDGFDELGSKQARDRMAHLVRDFCNTYDHKTNRFVVSTRIVGYEGQLDTMGFSLRTVQELSPQAVQDLVIRRYRAIAIGEGIGRSEQEQQDLIQQYEVRAQKLLVELKQNESLRLLTPNPLLLSLIVLVSLVRVKLPEQRHILYRDCVEILTERWQAERRAQSGALLQDNDQQGELNLDNKLTI